MHISYSVNSINEEGLEKSAIEIVKSVKPKWNIDKVSIKHYTEGLTNKLIGFYYQDFDDQILVRVSGTGTELYIDRQAEMKTVQLLFDKGLGPELYADFNNGFCYGFTPGIPITTSTVSSKEVYPKVAKMMAAMHRIEIENKIPKQFTLTRRFIELMPTNFTDEQLERINKGNITSEYFIEEINRVEKSIEAMKNEIVFSHNDLLMNNIILNDKTGTVHFIDYEYASPNYLYYDIGNHFCEFAGTDTVDYSLYPSADFAANFLRCYISHYRNIPENQVTASEVEDAIRKTNAFSLCSHLLWSSWALLQASTSTIDFDYIGYSIIRLKEYENRKEEFLSAL